MRFGRPIGLAAAVSVVLLSGCDIPPRPTIGVLTPSRDHAAVATLAVSDRTTPVQEVAAEPWESWSLYVRDGRPVGYNRVAVTPGTTDSQTLQVEVEDQLETYRGEATLRQSLRQRFVETADGGVREFETVSRVGPSVTRVRGDVRETVLAVEVTRGQRKSQHQIAWGPTIGGPAAIERSLRSEPLEPGETRSLKMMQGAGRQVFDVRLYCVGEAVVPLLDGSGARLLEINRTDIVEGEVVNESVLWTDRKGEVQRWLAPAFSAVAYRSTEDQVLEQVVESLQAEATVQVAVSGSIRLPAETQLALFEVGPSEARDTSTQPVTIDPAPGQWVKGAGDQTWQVLVNRLNHKAVKGFSGSEGQFTAADLAPSRIVDYTSRPVHDLVKRISPTIAVRDEQLGDLAQNLVKTTNEMTTFDRLGTGIPTASEVAKRARGDAVGQAILLAALLRSKKVPARVALGLRYRDGEPATMQFHAWTLAWYDDHWNPLDATLGFAAPADRIMLATLDLADAAEVDGHDQILDVVQRLGGMRIKVLKVQPASPAAG